MRDVDLNRWVVKDPVSVRDLVESINSFGLRTVFVTDSRGILKATVTDGDVRRALLEGHGLESPASTAFNLEYLSLIGGSDLASQVSQALKRGLTELPVVDGDGRLLRVEVLPASSLLPSRSNKVVIMAGGKGLRLRPLTDGIPKPLLPVGGKPILQHIIENLRSEGFCDIVIAINYLGEQIENFFKDGSSFGVKIEYLKEEKAMGTAGALSLLSSGRESPVVVMNGDLVLAASVGTLVDYHVGHAALITVGAKVIETNIPFGVLSMEGSVIRAIEEKPSYRDLVNAGIYVLDEKIIKTVAPGQITDMPELIRENIPDGKVLAFPIHEMWADLGRPSDFHLAQSLLEGKS